MRPAAASHQQLNQLHQFQSTNPSIKLNFDWMDGVDGLMIDELVDGAAAANTNQNKNLIFIFICFRPSLLAFLHPSAKERFSICWLDSGRGRKEMKANQQTTFIKENVGWLLSLFFLHLPSLFQQQSIIQFHWWLELLGCVWLASGLPARFLHKESKLSLITE